VALLFGKAAVWVIALSSGTSGGVLAPLLMMGASLGTIEAHILPFGDSGFWALLGMAALLGGTMRAPLTSTLFAVELTGNFHVMPAVLIASTAAFAMTVLLMRRSILTERIARRGLHLTREYSVDPFDVMRVAEIMAKPAHRLPASITVAEAITFFQAEPEKARHKSYPLVDEAERVVGMVSRSDILRWTRRGGQDDNSPAINHGGTNIVVGYDDELVGALADRMANAGTGRVPIIDRVTGKLVGLVARRDLLRVRAHAIRQELDRSRFR
jgi:CBS domain-containing protein